MINLDIAQAMAEATGITREQGLAVIQATTNAIAAALEEGDTVSLRGFGTFAYKTTTTTAAIDRPGFDGPATITHGDVAFKPGVIFTSLVEAG